MALVYVYNDFYYNDPDIYILEIGTIIDEWRFTQSL
jgi:hypothetical protein